MIIQLDRLIGIETQFKFVCSVVLTDGERHTKKKKFLIEIEWISFVRLRQSMCE